MRLATDGYAQAVAEYFKRPPRALPGCCPARAGSESAGAIVEVSAELREGRLRDMAFRAFGCPHIIAACNLLAERLEGERVETLVDRALPGLWQELEVPVEKAGKMLILQDALRALYGQLHEQTDAGPGSGKAIED